MVIVLPYTLWMMQKVADFTYEVFDLIIPPEPLPWQRFTSPSSEVPRLHSTLGTRHLRSPFMNRRLSASSRRTGFLSWHRCVSDGSNGNRRPRKLPRIEPSCLGGLFIGLIIGFSIRILLAVFELVGSSSINTSALPWPHWWTRKRISPSPSWAHYS